MQAVSSVSPFDATPYFKKIECFCFEKQFLKAGEQIEFPLVFMVQNDLEDDIYDLTLSYTLYTLDE